MTDFTYIAFDTESGQPVAHGRRAIDALARADSIAPAAPVYILFTGNAGPWMWAEKFPLEHAQAFVSNAATGER
jgi:hypothetical protein